jgi:hypothetical protein
VDGGILLPLVPFGIFFTVPKAQCQGLIGFCVRYQKGLVHNPACFFKIGSTFSLMVLPSSRTFPDLVVTSTVRVNMEALLSVEEKVKGTND